MPDLRALLYYRFPQLFVLSCLIASQAFSLPSKTKRLAQDLPESGPDEKTHKPRAADDHGEEECCLEKTVGDILYKLNPSKNLDAGMMERYNCLNGCIYSAAERPAGVRSTPSSSPPPPALLLLRPRGPGGGVQGRLPLVLRGRVRRGQVGRPHRGWPLPPSPSAGLWGRQAVTHRRPQEPLQPSSFQATQV